MTGLHDGGQAPELWMPLLYRGLALVPPGDDVTWARLTLLIERFEPVTVGVINGSRWLGSDPRATAIARDSGDEELFARSLQPWDLWDREWTSHLSNLIGTLHNPVAIIRADRQRGRLALPSWRVPARPGKFPEPARRRRATGIDTRPGGSPVRLGLIAAALGDLGRHAPSSDELRRWSIASVEATGCTQACGGCAR